jgi:RNA polymerase sigma factor (sigma-70 family)
MLEYQPKGDVEIKFSTWVINAYRWRIARLVHRENHQVNTQEYDDHPVECSLLAELESRDTQDGFWTIVQRELDDRSFRCLRKHCDGLTLEEIAKPEGVSRERVRQIIVKAVRALRVHQVAMRLYEAAGLRWFDGSD